MTDSAKPFAAKKFLEIEGRRMAYIDEGEGAPIVFAHRNPTSFSRWRNVITAKHLSLREVFVRHSQKITSATRKEH